MKNNSGKIRKTAKLIFIVGCVYAVITFISFITTISSYLSQGYPLFDVFKYLFASQLLPTVVQPFVLISGIAYIASCVADLFENQEHAHAVLEELKNSPVAVPAVQAEEAVEEVLEETEELPETVEEVTETAEVEEVAEAAEVEEVAEVAEAEPEVEEADVIPEETEAEDDAVMIAEEPEEDAIEVEIDDVVEEEPEEEKELAFKTDVFGITTIGIKEELGEEEDTDDEILESLDLNPAEIEINVLKNGITNISTKEPVVNVDMNKKGIFTVSRIK